MLELPPPMAPPEERLPVYVLSMVVSALVPVAEPLPLVALPVFCTEFDAVVVPEAEVLPPPPPPAASTEPVVACELFEPSCPVPAAAPVEAWPLPVLATAVVFLSVTIAALLEPAPIEPPVAMLPPPLLVTVTLAVLPVAVALPLFPVPVLELELEEEVVLFAAVPGPPPVLLPCAPPAAFVEGADAVDDVFPDCPVPEPEPLAAPAWPDPLAVVLLLVPEGAPPEAA